MSAESVPATAGHVAAAGDQLRRLADEYIDDLARRHPDTATELGDHRFDELLPDRSEAALADERRFLDGFAVRLTDLDGPALEPELRVDAALMAGDVARRLFEIEELREHTWNPLLANPGQAIYMLLARDYAPLPERLHSLAGRLARVPDALATAARQSRADAEGSPGDRDHPVQRDDRAGHGGRRPVRRGWGGGRRGRPGAAGRARGPGGAPRLARRPAGRGLRQPGADGFADPRLGPELFSRKLSLTLQTAADADAILARAEADLERISDEITRVAAGLGGTPREVLDRLGAAAPDGATILAFCAQALAAQTGLRPRPRPGHGLRRPGRADRHAGDQPGRRGRLLRPARAARAHAAADVHRRLADAGRLASRAGRLVLPRVQPAHGAQPDGARGHARALPAARARAAVRGLDPGCGPRSGRARSSRAGRSTPRS